MKLVTEMYIQEALEILKKTENLKMEILDRHLRAVIRKIQKARQNEKED